MAIVADDFFVIDEKNAGHLEAVAVQPATQGVCPCMASAEEMGENWGVGVGTGRLK